MAKTASAILSTPRMKMRRQGARQAGGMGAMGMGMPGGGGMLGGMGQLGAGRPGMGMPSPMRPQMPGGDGGMTIASPLQTGPVPTMAAAMGGGEMPAPAAAPTMSPAFTAPAGQPAAQQSYAPSTTASPQFTGGASQSAQGATGATDPWGYPTAPPYGPKRGRKGKKKFGGHNYAERAYRKLPPWLQDPSMFEQSIGSINEILARRGHISPENLIRNQADIEAGRGQGQQALQARLAAAGVDPSSPMYQSMAGQVDQGANRLHADARRQEEMDAFQRLSQALNMPIPYLQAILGMTTKKGGGGVTPTPGGGGGGSPDYLGAASNIAGSVLGGWASTGFA